MNKSFEILEALNDIDEKILIEALEDKKPKHINKTWVYFFTPTIALMVMLTCVIYINKNLKSDNLQLAKNNEIQNIVKDENKDNIIFNNNNIITASDIDGKSKKEDVISKFEFLKELNIPKEYSLINQYALYEKEDDDVETLAKAITDFKKNIKTCEICGCLSDETKCEVCMDNNRDKSTICVVEDSKNVFFIYHA